MLDRQGPRGKKDANSEVKAVDIVLAFMPPIGSLKDTVSTLSVAAAATYVYADAMAVLVASELTYCRLVEHLLEMVHDVDVNVDPIVITLALRDVEVAVKEVASGEDEMEVGVRRQVERGGANEAMRVVWLFLGPRITAYTARYVAIAIFGPADVILNVLRISIHA